jgi:alanyl aminopeptidase
LGYALNNTAGLLSVLEEYFGTPYPYRKLDVIAVPEGFGGAMENVGAITYDEYLILMDEDSALSQRRAFTSVHAHEMAHMWFGNLVTPSWWNDIWLNESFASWMENKAAHGYWPDGEFDRETLKDGLNAMAADSLAAAREIREPIAINEQIAGAFDSITYSKGGGVLAMLERYVGEEPFRKGVRLHMERHAHSTATAEDFIASLAEGSERVEIGGVFESYIAQAGVPVLSVRLDCDDEQHPSLEISQARYAPLGSTIDPADGKWQVPVCINFVDGDTRKSTCELLSEKKQSIGLEADHCPTQVHPNADGAGYYRFSMGDAGWLDLMSGVADSPAAEALVLADSLDAAFRADVVSADIYVAGMAALSNHDAWDVADAATAYLEAIIDILEAGQMDPVEDAVRDIVRPRFAALAGTSDAGSRLLRQRLQRFLVVVAKDETMRETMAARAAARIGLDGDPDPSAVSESELETVLTVGVQDLGELFFDLLLEQAMASRDPAFRSSAMGALGRVEDPALVRKLQVALLTGSFKGTEFTRILFRQMAREATAAQTYAWVKEHDDVVIERIPETFRSKTMPALGGSFCGAEQAADWQAFIESHGDKLPGYERSLAQATEGIRLCAALRKARGAELATAFERL